jgi:hypothetical protein
MLDISVQVGGGFDSSAMTRDLDRQLKRAALRASHKAALGARDEIRSSMRGARLGGLANAIRHTSDQRKGRLHTRTGGGFSASGTVYVAGKSERTLGAIEAYTEGAAITAKRGRWLAFVASDQIPRRVGRRRMTPELYRSGGLEQRIGPLQFVRSSRPSVAYLVAEDVSIRPDKRGSARRLPKNGKVRGNRVQVGIVAFVLIKATRRSKRLDPLRIAARHQALMPQYLEEALGHP